MDDVRTDASEKPVRVLHVITRMIVGGAQENTLLSVEGLDRLPWCEATLCSGIDNGPEGEMLSRARQTTRLLIVPQLCRNVNPFADVAALWKLYRLIVRGRYHIVHTHSSKASFGSNRGMVGADADRRTLAPQPGFSRLPAMDRQPVMVARKKTMRAADRSLHQRLGDYQQKGDCSGHRAA